MFFPESNLKVYFKENNNLPAAMFSKIIDSSDILLLFINALFLSINDDVWVQGNSPPWSMVKP